MNDYQLVSNSMSEITIQQSVLGERNIRIPVCGKIRGGSKRLTRKAENNPKAIETYNAGVAAGASFKAIEKRIKEQCNIDYPLTPQNLPYFSARRCDFAIHETADRIMDMYGEDRGDGKHLYKFPIILISDLWLTNMPHGLRCYTSSQLKYWSEYQNDGNRYCKMRAPVEIDKKSKRACKTFGGRKTILRPENDGRCNPDICKEYQTGKCKVTGGLIFYIPGVPGSSAIELPTTSLYGMQQLRQQMETVAFISGGKISGTLDGKPIFWLTKVNEEVAMIDGDGKVSRVKQWLPHLESDLPMTELFQHAEARELKSLGGSAAALLEGSTQKTIGHDDNVERPIEDVAREAILKALGKNGIDPDLFTAFADEQWGSSWMDNVDVLAEIQTKIDNDIESLIEEVERFDAPF